MKKLLTTFILLLLLTQNLMAFNAGCDAVPSHENVAIEQFAADMLAVTAKAPGSHRILAVTVNYLGEQGKGNVYVQQDENGDIAGVRIDFKINGGKQEIMTLTFDELQAGSPLEYKESKNAKAALIVKKAPGETIYFKTGGKFVFQILTQKSPPKYKDHVLYLRKEGSSWLVKNENGSKRSSVGFSPDVGWDLEWKGTFNKASFN
jgi:hypothetical protein